MNEREDRLISVPFATVAINSFKDSLGDCQFYETVNYEYTVRMGERKSADYESTGHVEPVVVVDIDCTEEIRRFGDKPFRVYHETDDGVEVKNISLSFKKIHLSQGKDFIIEGLDEKDRMLGKDSKGWCARLKDDKKESEVLTVKYSVHFSDYDHWTEINWAANHPIRKMRATVVCRDGLSLQESADITDKNHRVCIESKDAGEKIYIKFGLAHAGTGLCSRYKQSEEKGSCSRVWHDY